MDLLEFFTGHSSDEASVYENQDKVDLVVGKLTDLGKKGIPNFTENIVDAVNSFNSVNGVGTYISDLDPGYFTTMMDEIGSGVITISTKISGAAEDIKAYNEATPLEKIGSSASMLLCKIGEGFLSVFEGIGDAVISVAGWIAPKGSDFEKMCEDAVKVQWSHDVFNFYYNSDFAKKSAFTEDSAIAGIGKIAGTVAAFVVPGMAFSAVAGAIGEGASAAIGIANTIANSSKIINVVSAGLIGMGAATESGLLAGKSMDDAALAGAGAGLLSAGLAFGISTAAEKLGSVLGKGAGAADDVLNKADDVLNQTDDMIIGGEKTLEKGLAGKGAGVAEDVINQGDEFASAATKERLALPGTLEDGTVVGKPKGYILSDAGESYRGTSLKTGTTYTAESGKSYYLSGSITPDDVATGSLKHMAEDVSLSTSRMYNPDEAVSVLQRAAAETGDQSFAKTAERISSQGQEFGLKSKLGKQVSKAYRELSQVLPDEELASIDSRLFNKTISADRITSLATKSGIEFPQPELLSKTTPLTASEVQTVEEYAATASKQIYANALEKFDQGVIIANGQATQVTDDLLGVPVIVDGSVSSAEPHYVEVLTRLPNSNEGATITTKHLLSKSSEFADGITTSQAVTNQAERAIKISVDGGRHDVIQRVVDASAGETLSDTQILNRVAGEMANKIVVPGEELYIQDPTFQQRAIQVIQEKLFGSTADQDLISQILSNFR